LKIKPLSTDDLEMINLVSQSKGWNTVSKFVDIQKKNLAELSILATNMEDLSNLRGQRTGIENLFRFVDKGAEKELEERNKHAQEKKETSKKDV